MSSSPLKPLVLITGGNGHLGYHLVREFLEHGYPVRTTVRDLASEVRMRHLKVLQDTGADLEIVQAELLEPASLREAVRGVEAVIHSAAPNVVWDRDPETAIVRPILEGTRNMLAAALEAGVRKFVFTSSCSAVGMDAPAHAPLTEDRWYHEPQTELIRAKIDAERYAWALVKGKAMKFISICVPSMVGPGFHRHTPVTLSYQRAWEGKGTPLPALGFHLVDVRDVAAAHRLACERPNAQGRYIVAGDYLESRDLIRLIKRVEPRIRIAETTVPRWVLRVFCAFDWLAHKLTGRRRELTLGMVREFSGKFQRVSADKARRDLGFTARPAEETMRDTFQWIRTREGQGAVKAGEIGR